MQLSKITSRGQTTIPKQIRESIKLEAGDLVSFEIGNDCVLMRKVAAADDGFLRGLTGTLKEWNSPEDEAAWSDL